MTQGEAERIEAKPVAVDRVFRTCPECQYRDGFHVALERGKGPGRTTVLLRLICPSCHTVYDVGLGAFLK